MTENQKNLKIYFTKKYNNKVEQETYYTKGDYLEDNVPFKADLIYTDYIRGRSALNIEWYDKRRDRYYYSGMPLLHEFLLNGKIKDNMISGEFVFKKQGTSVLLTKYK